MATLFYDTIPDKLTVLVLCLILISGSKAVRNRQNESIQCIDYDWGVQCHSECSSNCTCTLTDVSFISNCTDGSTSARQVLYPSGDVTNLYWNGSTVHKIQPGAFVRFGSSYQILILDNVGLLDIQHGTFAGLWSLEQLWMDNNALCEIHSGMFEGLLNLQWLGLSNNTLHKVEPRVFVNLTRLRYLYLGYNSLQEVHRGMFAGLENLEGLFLQDNALYDIQPDAFTNMTRLKYLNLGANLLREVCSCLFAPFRNVISLDMLDLSGNALHEIKPFTFASAPSLKSSSLDMNAIGKIQVGAFGGLHTLFYLFLHSNALHEIASDAFGSLRNLEQLWLCNNSLSFLHPGTFENQTKLSYLRLDQNQLAHFPKDIYDTMREMRFLNLAQNSLNQIPALKSLIHVNLKAIILKSNLLLWIPAKAFSGLNERAVLSVSSPATCNCFASHLQCYSTEPRSPYLTCMRMLNFDVLRTSMWFMSIFGLFGNIFGLCIKFKHRRQSNAVQFLLISNLSLSDLTVSIFLLILLSVDAYYVDFFPSSSEHWRRSLLCRFAGALSVLSSEASAFLITLISTDRFLGVKYPFGGKRMGTKLVRSLVAIQWLLAFSFSITTFVLSGMDSDLYANSEVCIGLPISRHKVYNETFVTVKVNANAGYFNSLPHTDQVLQIVGSSSKVSAYLSIATFTGLNLACFSVVGSCYTAIFVTARTTTRASGRSQRSHEEMRMAIKMSLLVLTDFCCWVPIGILSILVQAGVVEVSPVAYAWIATFVLPINSTLNPFLYTIAGYLCDRKKWKCCKRSRGQEENIMMRRK